MSPTTYSVSKAALPSKIPTGRVVREFPCMDLPVSIGQSQPGRNHTQAGG